MRWVTHQAGAFVSAFALAMPLVSVGAAIAGSVFPDVIDRNLSNLASTRRGRQRVFNQTHRGSSHWAGWWLGLFLLLLALPLPALPRDMAIGFVFGALSHIFMDFLTTRGVPISPFSRKNNISCRICSTGSFGEYVILAAIIAFGALYFSTTQ